eukprot:6458718-Amphidinium_carterae.1
MSSWLEKIGRGRASNGVKASLWNALQHKRRPFEEGTVVCAGSLDQALGVESCTVEKLGELSVFSTNFDDWLEKQQKSSTGIRKTAIE